jgi:hypothetical protein
VEEAHASDDWALPIGAGIGRDVKLAKRLDDRISAAKRFVRELDYPIEVVCDSMVDEVVNKYEAFPERLYIIENGVVVFKGGRGPHDYNPKDVLEWLQRRYGDRMDRPNVN